MPGPGFARLTPVYVAGSPFLDDDPTGSQTVHDVAIVTGFFAPEDYRPCLASPGSTCFILTNTRSMDASHPAALNHDLGRGTPDCPFGHRSLRRRSGPQAGRRDTDSSSSAEIRRAEVIGQMLPGLVSVLRPVDATPEVVACRTWCLRGTSAMTKPSPM